MKENHYIARIVQYIATKYQEIKLKNYNRKIKEYLVKNHVRGDFHTLKIPLTTQIYTGETVRKPLRGDNRILNVGLSPKQS